MNTDNCNYFSGLRDIIYVNRMNDIKYKDNICKMSLFDKKNYILFHKAEYSDILNEDYTKITEYFNNVLNDLLFLRTYLSQTIRKKGKSLIIAHVNDPFFKTLYKCLKEEYREKIDFIIL